MGSDQLGGQGLPGRQLREVGHRGQMGRPRRHGALVRHRSLRAVEPGLQRPEHGHHREGGALGHDGRHHCRGQLGRAWAGAQGGALIGAAVGGPVGAVVGGLIGGFVGGGLGGMVGDFVGQQIVGPVGDFAEWAGDGISNAASDVSNFLKFWD